MDDHGRTGYEFCNEKLEDILVKLKGYENEYDGQKNWEEIYNYPIKQYMDEYNMKYHYG